VDGRLVVSVPMGPREVGEPDLPRAAERERPIPREAEELGAGETRDDVGSARQSKHGETGAL
jgi:hypothetical protein